MPAFQEEVSMLEPDAGDLLPEENEEVDEPPEVEEEGQQLLEEGQCNRVIVRWGELGQQDLHGGPDPKFPDGMDSIAAEGGDCGDTAAGIQNSCTKYNKWASFEDIVKHKNKKFEVMAEDGANYHDVAQGALGTCYMLAAMASIAHSDPKAIQRMFVNRDKWAQGVYTTRWLLGGSVGNVEVNDKIPTNPARQVPFFVKPSSAGEWWPVILEKAWAKIFGSFKAVEGGFWGVAVQAITMAPIESHSHNNADAAKIMAMLKEATAKGWPMGAGTTAEAKDYGLATSHAYSVLNASHDAEYGDVVLLFTPWNKDFYKGAVPNEHKSDGLFRMKLSEYLVAFRSTSVAKVNDDYEMASKKIQAERTAIGVWEVSVEGDKPFYATLAWPGGRIVKPCKMPSPAYNFLVMKKGSSEPVAVAPSSTASWAITSVSVEVKAGAGDYVIVAGLDFPKQDAVHEGHLIVHSEKSVSIVDSKVSPGAIFGPVDKEGEQCSVTTIKPIGTFQLRSDKLVGGVATYWSSDEKDLAYWNGKAHQWYIYSVAKFELVKNGEKFGTHWTKNGKFTKEAMSCGCGDDAEGVGGFSNRIPCNRVTAGNAMYGNVKCENTKHSKKVQRYCPKTCRAAFCKSAGDTPAPTPAPTPEPTPAPTPPPGPKLAPTPAPTPLHNGPLDQSGSPCSTVSIEPMGMLQLEAEKLVRGFPTYWSFDQKDFAYWHAGSQKWFVIGTKYFEGVRDGGSYGLHWSSNGKFTKGDLSCGCADMAGGVRGWTVKIQCSEVTEDNHKYSSIKCHNAHYSTRVQRYCPMTCGVASCV